MSKPLLGLIVGSLLGLLDGAFAWVYPVVRDQYLSVVLGSTVKGLVAGLIAGFVAKKTNSMALGIVTGFVFGLLFAYLVAMTEMADGKHYYLEIMLPGSILGGITGFVAQRYGRPARKTA
ncbi:MAG: hypothetical protein RL885_17620 [Planctomycetota bacterium]